MSVKKSIETYWRNHGLGRFWISRSLACLYSDRNYTYKINIIALRKTLICSFPSYPLLGQLFFLAIGNQSVIRKTDFKKALLAFKIDIVLHHEEKSEKYIPNDIRFDFILLYRK